MLNALSWIMAYKEVQQIAFVGWNNLEFVISALQKRGVLEGWKPL